MSLNIFSTRNISFISTLFLLVSLCFSISAQEKPGGKKVLIDGKIYTTYTAVSGDSPLSIARKFGITLDELNSANPGIINQLNSGQTVKIPVIKSNSKPQIQNGLLKDDHEDRFFSYHSVRRRETVFSIAQKNNVTSEDIYSYNPQSRDGIKEGDVLKIPKPFSNETKESTNKIQQPVRHIVGRRETLYSIARQYNTTQEEILKINPSVKGVLLKGTVLIIPGTSGLPTGQEKSAEVMESGDNKINPKPDNKSTIKTSPIAESIESSSPVSYANLNKTFEIGVFLPFCQNLNDSSQIAQRTSGFLEFYSGVLLAAEKMTAAGMKLKLFVYDTYHDSKVVEKLVKKPEFLSLDLIIGPVYPENQKNIAELSAKNHIPMISPLSSDSRFVATTPGYYQINPARKLRLTGTADYIAGKFANQNIIVLNHGTNSGDEKLILDRLNQKIGPGKVVRRYNIWAEGTSSLEAMLKADVENIIILTEENEANVSVALTRLNTISKSNKITVIGLQEYTKMQSIDIEYLHNTRFHYLAPYFIDYTNPKVNKFIEKYRSAYSNEPTQYSFQGYDIALHFIASLGKSGKNFPISNPRPGVDLLQADYSFQKLSDFGGYMNRTLYIIEYTDSFEVRSSEKINVPIITNNVEENRKNSLNQ